MQVGVSGQVWIARGKEGAVQQRLYLPQPGQFRLKGLQQPELIGGEPQAGELDQQLVLELVELELKAHRRCHGPVQAIQPGWRCRCSRSCRGRWRTTEPEAEAELTMIGIRWCLRHGTRRAVLHLSSEILKDRTRSNPEADAKRAQLEDPATVGLTDTLRA